VVRLRIVPGSVCGTLEQGWFRRKVLANAGHLVGGSDTLASDSAEAPTHCSIDQWAGAIDAALLELGKTAALQGARLKVELADSLMHLDVVAGDFVGDSDRQLHSVAAACVAELLGDAAQGYEIRWQLQEDGKHLLIGAVARDLLGALSAAATHHSMTLDSIQTDLCLQWNRHATALKPGAAVFAVASGREAVIACVSNGAITAISHGAWLDRQDVLDAAAARIKTLMCGLGLEPSATAGLLDTRADRLLASLGLDAANQSAYVLVAPELADKAVSSRWTVLNRELHAQ
jgi:hypothetical protein